MMNGKSTMIVATDGQAIMRTHDAGKNWYRLNIGQDLEYDDCVRCLLNDPRNNTAIFAGTERGLFRSENCGAHWHRVDCALNNYAIWKLAAAPSNPDIMYAGTGSPTRAICFRSSDAGKSWTRVNLEMPERCAGVSRPRMLALAVDPCDPNDVMVGVEEGGLFRSRDGGESWDRIDTTCWEKRPGNSDIHDILILPGDPKVIVVLSVISIYRSIDDGKTWSYMGAKDALGLRYARCLLRKPGSNIEIMVGIGDGTPGTTAAVLKSRDAGASWEPTALSSDANSCLWAFGGNVADPDLLMAGTKFGDLFLSMDGGENWQKQWREFSEITALAWLPSVPVDMELPHVTE